MTLMFSNNAEAVLASPLPSDGGDPAYGIITVVIDPEKGDAFHDFYESSGKSQLATLTHESMPGTYEVVRIFEHASGSGVFRVERQYESDAQEWPAGTAMSARVTAKTLDSFLQNEAGLVRFGTEASDSFAFGAYPALRDRRASPTNGTYNDNQDKLFAPEVVGGSIPVDLGEATAWYTNSHYPLAVVAPTVPDGFQYWLDLARGASYSGASLAPEFAGDTDVTVAYDGVHAVGFWVPTALPIDISIRFGGDAKLVLTEVGFMARDVSATTTPSVSVGTNVDSTRFVNNQALSQITGRGQVHRFPITEGGEMVEYLRFSVGTAATGGSFRGRFYWRGFFLNDYE